MHRFYKLTLIIFMFVLAYFNGGLCAEDASKEGVDRYDLISVKAGEIKNAIIPAMVLDSYRGIVWTCHNLQDARSSWIKTDLGQHGDKPMIRKKYS
ncbi:MAG: hypothetical protein ABIA66_03860, partial [Candidatus Omnitrophota bacterium]